MKNMQKIKGHFAGEAFTYDGLIPKLIPEYHEQNKLIVDLIDLPLDTELKALDLGCGTGVLGYLIMKKFPKAKVHFIDLTSEMLDTARKNLKEYIERTTWQVGDMQEADLGCGYDIIVSGLSIHHLENEGKEQIYRKIYQALKRGGRFINRDVFLHEDDTIAEDYHARWREFIRNHGEDDEKWFRKYREEDDPTSLTNQLGWLADAGFSKVQTHWQHLLFAIFGGIKE